MNLYEKMVKNFEKRAREGKKLSRTKAVRMKCLDCMCFQPSEVRICPATDCPLWHFRLGRDTSGKRGRKSPGKASKSIVKGL